MAVLDTQVGGTRLLLGRTGFDGPLGKVCSWYNSLVTVFLECTKGLLISGKYMRSGIKDKVIGIHLPIHRQRLAGL